jgi:cytochrome subunit of sulfide dehydrogenase
MKRTLPLLLAATALCVGGSSVAQGIDARIAARIAANCANCHGTLGRSSGVTPSLAGRPKAQFIETMQQFRDGKREATVMHQHAKGYTVPETEALAEHFARLSAAR